MNTNVVYKNAIALLLVQFSNYIAPLLVLPYLSRVLGIEGFGLIMMTLSLCSLSYLFIDYGFNLSASYWIAKHRDRINKVSQYVGAVFIIKLGIYLVLLLVLVLYHFLGDSLLSQRTDLLTLTALVALSQAFQPIWFFQGIEKMRSVTIYMVTSKLLYLVLIFLFVRSPSNENYVLLSLMVSNLISTMIALLSIYKEGYGIRLPSILLIRYVFKASTGFFMSRVAVSIYTTASTFIVGNIAGLGQAAVYSAAEKLYQAGQSVTSPISQALYPHLARTKSYRILFKFMIITFPVMVVGCGIVFYYADFFLKLIYGGQFTDSVRVLRVFLISTLVTFVSINFGYPAFAAIGKVKLANKTVLFGGFTQSVLLILLYSINEISALSVAYCVLITESIVLFTRVFLLHLCMRKRNYNV